MPEGPRYITAPARVMAVDAEAGTLPTFPTVRIYKAYEPWGEATIEQVLEARGYVRGVNLFVDPLQDLRGGIPEGTSIVMIPSATGSGRVRGVNAPPARRALRRFVDTGGSVVMHRFSPGPPYRVPTKGRRSRRLVGYDVHERGAGAVYSTDRAVDHPAADPVARLLDRLLGQLLR